MNDGVQSFESHSHTRRAPLTRPRPKVAPSELPPGAAIPLGDYRKTLLVNDARDFPSSKIPQPPAETILRLPDEELERTMQRRTHDTHAKIRVQMDNLAQSLLVDAPMRIQEEWLMQPTKYRQFVLSGIPSPKNSVDKAKTAAWLEQFGRLVALDIRARKLGSIQAEESPFWREVLERDAKDKRTNTDENLQHNNSINQRAEELYDEWKSMPSDERAERERDNNKLRAHQKFVLLRAQDTCRAKHYATQEDAERDAQMLDKLGDSILVKDRFAQLIDTSSERTAMATAEFDDDEPTVLKARTLPPVPPKPPAPQRPGFFRRMTAPFVAAASLLVGLGGAQQTAERSTNLLSQPDTKEQAYANGIAVPSRLEATVEAPRVEQADSPAAEKVYTVEKGDRLWDIARQEIADERGVALKRVARNDREILPRVHALKILNDIDDATKLEIGTELKLEKPTANPELRTSKEETQAYGNGVAVPSRLDTTPSSSIGSVADLVTRLDAAANGGSEAPREVIKSRGDTAWAHADRMLHDAKIKSTHARRQLIAALMLRDSGNLNAYKLRIGQELATTRANDAITALKTGKNPADIARAAGIPWPPKNL